MGVIFSTVDCGTFHWLLCSNHCAWWKKKWKRIWKKYLQYRSICFFINEQNYISAVPIFITSVVFIIRASSLHHYKKEMCWMLAADDLHFSINTMNIDFVSQVHSSVVSRQKKGNSWKELVYTTEKSSVFYFLKFIVPQILSLTFLHYIIEVFKSFTAEFFTLYRFSCINKFDNQRFQPDKFRNAM